MASPQNNLAETMSSPESGAILRRGIRPTEVLYGGQSIIVDLPGYYPEGDGEGVHVGHDLAILDEALRTLKEKVDGLPSPASIRRVRKKLNLSQRDAGILLKVGESAFDKYERGVIEPSGPTTQLLRLLERHPELVQELRRS